MPAPLSPDAGEHPADRLSDAERAQLAQTVMRKQLDLSLRVAVVFLVLLLGLPLVNWLLPEVAGANIGGFTLSWLFLGVLFYPLTWLLSGYFIRESDRIESEIARDAAAASEKAR